MKIGLGYDSHRLTNTPGAVVLGGVKIDGNYSTVAHSDGDVIAHALIDAIAPLYLEKSIGELYSDKDENDINADSMKRLKEVYNMCLTPSIINIDIVVQTDEINIASITDEIKTNISKVLNVEKCNIGVKGKTTEGVSPVGLHFVQVWCVVLFN